MHTGARESSQACIRLDGFQSEPQTESEARYGTGRTQNNLLARTPYEDSRRPWHHDYACSRRSHIHWTTSYPTTCTSCSLSVARAPCRRNTNATSKPKARRQELQGDNQPARPALHTAVPHAHARIHIHGQSHTYIHTFPAPLPLTHSQSFHHRTSAPSHA